MKKPLSPTFLACVINLSFFAGVCWAECGWATELLEHSPLLPGNQPEKVLGPPDCPEYSCSPSTAAECSVSADGEPGSGIPGYILLGFGARFYDVAGDDFRIVVYDLNTDEQFNVYACESPEDCIFVCRIDPLEPGVACGCQTCSFECDLADAAAPITSANYIMIENDREDPNTVVEGPEVDAVCVAVPVCGDGVTEGPEECDDGNTNPGDGCSETCMIEPVDSDGDGIPDDVDNCPSSDLRESIIIDDCDTGVDNELFDDGCTMVDQIAECAYGATTHGEFASCVAQLTKDWKQDDLISGQEKGRIQSCAAQGDLWSQCQSNADCDDSLFCNGVEVCLDGACVVGDPCPGQSCDEAADECTD